MSRSSLARAALLVVVLGIAAWARLADVGAVLGRGEVIPTVDGDSAYHLVRIRHAVEHFPALPTVDPAMNWPFGGACPWADGFDLLGALVALAGGGRGDPGRTDVIAGLLPLILGLLVVWGTMGLARRVARRGRRGGVGVAAAAGLVVAVLPAGVVPARYGAVDHHVAEALSMVWLASWALVAPAPGRRALAWEAAGAGAVAFACWTFTGAPLYVALSAPVLAVRVLRTPRPAWIGGGAAALLAGAAAAALLSVPALRQHGRALSFQVPSLLQPLLVAVAGAAVALAIAVGRRAPAAGPMRRAGLLVFGGAALLAVASAVAPAVPRELVTGLDGWLLRRDPWLAIVDEFQPTWGGGRGWVAGLAGILGAAGVVAPVLVAVGGACAVRRGARGWAFAALSTALLGLTLLQVRFGRVLAPFVAVNAALVIELVAWAAVRLARRPRALAGATLAASLAFVGLDPRLRDTLRVPAARELAPDAEAALALRPAPGDPPRLDPGVIAHWGSGHLIRLLSGRPVVVNGFGAYLDEATFWRLGRIAVLAQEDLDRLMRERRVGFLVTGAPYVGPVAMSNGPDGWVLAPDAMRRLPMSPVVIAGSGIPERGVPHLRHLMPFFAAAQAVPGIAFAVPWLWAFERVPGARLTGRAAAGDRIVVEIPFTERGRPHVWRGWSDADPDGRFEVVVPLPTDLARPTLRTAPSARVRAGEGDPVPLAIPEQAVRAGGVIRIGPLARGG